MPKTAASPDTLESLRAFDITTPNDEEREIQAEIEEVSAEIGRLGPALRALSDRYAPRQSERSNVEALHGAGLASDDELAKARSEEEAHGTAVAEMQSRIDALQATLQGAQARLAAAKERKTDAFQDRILAAQCEAAQRAIDALLGMIRARREQVGLNKLAALHGLQGDHMRDRYVYKNLYQYTGDVYGYFHRMGEQGFTVPGVDELKELFEG